MSLNDDADKVFWGLEKSGIFSVKSLYRYISFGGRTFSQTQKLWKSKIPLKVKIFLWLLFQDRLQMTSNLKKRKWKGNENCILCGVREDSNHLFFTYVLASFVWTCVKGCLNWQRIPTSLDDFQQFWLDDRGAHTYHISLFSFAALVWSLWKVRNKMAIEKSFPKQPITAFFKSLSCLQRWKILLKEEDRQKIDAVITRAEVWLKAFVG